MKRTIAIVISVIFIALALVSCKKNTDVPEGMYLATDNTFYTMFLPEGWEKIETGTDVTLGQATTGKDKLNNVTVNALYWTITAEEIDGESDEDRANRLFDEYYNRYKSQLTGEYDQLVDGTILKKITIAVIDKENDTEDQVKIKVGEVTKIYSFKINGDKMELYDSEGNILSDLDGYITLKDGKPTMAYYYGTEYKINSDEEGNEGGVYTGKEKAEGLFEDFKEIGEPSDLTVNGSQAREYVYTAKYGDLQYKYYTTVIIHGDFYYVITFTFPEIVQKDGDSLNKTGTFEDSDYSDDMEKVVTNFRPKK